MYEDEPQDKVHDVLDEAIFGEHPLGQRVIGSAEVIGSIPVPEIAAYHDQRYVGPNIVIAAAGNIDHGEIKELAQRFLEDRLIGAPTDGPSPDAPGREAEEASVGEPSIGFQSKATEQYHVCLGATGISRSDERRFALRVLNTVFGGSSSSRLFREVREKRGLAYSVGSYLDSYRETGLLGLYVGTREENVAEALDVIGAELARLEAEEVSADELARAKESVKGRLVLSQESMAVRMSRLAGLVLFDLPMLGLDELLEKIDSVTPAELREVAGDLYSPERFSAACIGRSEDRFREALGPVSEALVAA